MKTPAKVLFSVAFLLIGSVFIISNTKSAISPKRSEDRYNLTLLSQKNQLEKEGRGLEKSGKFDEAIAKYKEAVSLDQRIYGSDKGRPLAALTEVYQKQGEYEVALEVLKGLRKFHSQHEYYADWEKELTALIQAKNTNAYEPVYAYIRYFRGKYSKNLPPKGYSFGSIDKISTIFRLYNTIGDHDAGIKFIDEVLEWSYKKDDEKAIGQLKGRITTSAEAETCMKLDYKNAKAQGLDQFACRWLGEYLKIREGFERDKAEGFKGCAGKKPGEVCMGHATKALIESDYFPW